MKHYLAAVFTLIAFALFASTSALAQPHMKTVVALKTDDFKLDETDISTLAVGEAKTIETDNGKIIDILRTSEGAEIYVDGELVEMNFNHEDHCNHEVVVIPADEDIDLEQLHQSHEDGNSHKLIVIKKTLVTED